MPARSAAVAIAPAAFEAVRSGVQGPPCWGRRAGSRQPASLLAEVREEIRDDGDDDKEREEEGKGVRADLAGEARGLVLGGDLEPSEGAGVDLRSGSGVCVGRVLRVTRGATSTSSHSNLSSEFGGMSPLAMFSSPYARRAGIINVRLPPWRMVDTPSSHPGMTLPLPISKVKGVPRSYELSNLKSDAVSQPV